MLSMKHLCKDTTNTPHTHRFCICRWRRTSGARYLDSHRCEGRLVALDSSQAKVSQIDCSITCHQNGLWLQVLVTDAICRKQMYAAQKLIHQVLDDPKPGGALSRYALRSQSICLNARVTLMSRSVQELAEISISQPTLGCSKASSLLSQATS